MKPRTIIGMMIIFSIGFLIFLGFGLQNNPTILPSVLENKPLPRFNATSLENPAQSINETHLKGPALVNIWATWCPTCQAEHKMLNTLAKQGIKIYGINYKDDSTYALKWLKDLGNPYVFNINDNQGQIGLDLGVYGAPETFFIDVTGKIIHRHVGDINPQNWNAELLPIWQKLNRN